MKNLLSAKDLDKKKILEIFKLTNKLKGKKKNVLKGKNIALIFQKPSTRTRVSFAVAVNDLGGNAIALNWNELQLGRSETIEDTTKVLERYVDCIIARVFSHQDLLKMSKISKIPIINALSDLEHPCQALADLYTIKEKKGLKKLKIVFFGDGANNTFASLIYLCERFGFEIVVASPKQYSPKIHAKFKIISNPKVAVKNADIIFVDTFVSMGEEKEEKRRLRDLKRYQVNSKLVSLAKKDCIVMHPLPAHRGIEITSDVMDSKKSVVWTQAENRLHTQKAILYLLLR